MLKKRYLAGYLIRLQTFFYPNSSISMLLVIKYYKSNVIFLSAFSLFAVDHDKAVKKPSKFLH